jgi:hypothetical protein
MIRAVIGSTPLHLALDRFLWRISPAGLIE